MKSPSKRTELHSLQLYEYFNNREHWFVEETVLLHLTDAEGLVTKKCIKPASASHLAKAWDFLR